MVKRKEPSLLCSFSNYKMSEALAADCESSEWTEQEVGRDRRWQEGYSAHREGGKKRKRADGDSVNEVNVKNGKGENQSG